MQLLAYIGTGYFSRPEGQSFIEIGVIVALFIICSAAAMCTCFATPSRAIILTSPPIVEAGAGGPLGQVLGKCRREIGIMQSYVQETLGDPPAPHSQLSAPVLSSVSPCTDFDRRRWVRHPSNLLALCWVPECREAGVWIGRVVDISEGGLRLLSPRPLEQGTVLSVRPKNPTLPCDRILEAEVMFVGEVGPREWALGCEFVCELTDEERRAYL